MKLNKYFLFGIILLVLLAATVLISLGCSMQAENASVEFSEHIECIKQGEEDELRLTIYYMSPYILTQWPLSKRELIEERYEYKITVSGTRLREHIDLLELVANADLTPIENESYVDARLYYAFETKKNRKIFDVCMWSSNGGIIVNGFEVEENHILYEVVLPFLPEDAAENWEEYLNDHLGEQSNSSS